MTREGLIKLAREIVEKTTDVHEYHGIPAKFDPHEWVLEAMSAAYNLGHQRGGQFRQSEIDEEMRAHVRSR